MRKSLVIVAVGVVLAGAVLVFLLFVPLRSAGPTAQVSVTPPAGTTTYQGAEVDNFTFSPGRLQVEVGTRVVWTNIDSVNRHTVTSDGALFDSGVLDPRGSFEFLFAQPGTYAYHCNIHPWTTGTVEVAA